MTFVQTLQPDAASGVFSTLLVVDGAPVELAAHLERLRASVRELYARSLPAEAAQAVEQAARGQALARLRLTVEPDGDGPPRLSARAVAIERALVLPGWERALELRTAVVERWRGAHKWADRRLLEQLDAEAAPAGALLVDGTGAALETTRSNLFAVAADGVLRTPPADGSVLPGVNRARVLELARAAGVETREEPISHERLHEARELFTTGSVRGVEHVRALDGVAFDGPGEIAGRLQDELRRRWFG